jgi:pimeloyl-ACP methyl ester carboxylesterase
MKQIVLRDGRQLSYSDCGMPDGLPLLFHHGTPFTNYASPEGLIDETGFRLIRFSRPGYAHSSPKPGRRCSLSARRRTYLSCREALARVSPLVEESVVKI